MSTPSSDQRTFSESLIALLCYYGHGNTQRFASILDRTLAYASARVNSEQKRYLRNLLLDRLTIFGLLETHWKHGTRRWTVASNRLIALNDANYLVFGDLGFLDRMRQRFPSSQWSSHRLYALPKQTGLGAELSLDSVEVSKVELERAATDQGLEVIWQVFGQQLELVPPISRVQRASVEPGIVPSDIQATEIKQFDFHNFEWQDRSHARGWVTGYYRVPHVYGQHRDFAVKRIADSTIGFEIGSREWSFLLASQIIGHQVEWKYNTETSELMVPAQQISFVPTLLKRALCRRMFRWPSLESGAYVFQHISLENITVLRDRMPMLRINYE